jgi:hypothetical protein
MTYDAWFGFESLPVLDKSNPDVRALVNGDDGVARYWLERGVDAWRLDVMGDLSFPADFWPEFRAAVKSADPDSPIIGELWKKFEVLPKIHGDEADSAMNYRFRNAILGFFGTVDHKGFYDDGQSDQPPSLFVRKLMSIREDYPDAVYYTLLNIFDSHDTQRILWSLTPGENNRDDKEFNSENLERGKQLLRLAVVAQMTMPGAPTIYYGDEIGMTGDDDPDDRRTLPWSGRGPYGIGGDTSLLVHYRQLTRLRHAQPVLRTGEVTFLLADDERRTLAYLLRMEDAAALVALNRSDTEQALTIDLRRLLPDAVQLSDALGTLNDQSAVDGSLSLTLPPLGAAVLLPTPEQDLSAPAAPGTLDVEEGDGEITLTWDAVTDAASYIVYRSPVTGGGYEQIAEVSATTFMDTDITNGQRYYYVVRAVDAAGNEGAPSNEVQAQPSYSIGWANLQFPSSLTHTLSAITRTEVIYGQVWIDSVTDQPGATPALRAQLGFGPQGSDPADTTDWTWVEAVFNVDAGNNDEFVASLQPETTGVFAYLYRYTTTDGGDWLYADLDGPVPAGQLPANPGKLTVLPSGDMTPPAVPTGLTVVSASPAAIELAWNAVADDSTLFGYEVLRADRAGGPYILLAVVARTAYSDTALAEGATYFYAVRAVDTAYNRSESSAEVQAEATQSHVRVTFVASVPENTPTDASVYIAGTLDRLDASLSQWNPSATILTTTAELEWTISLTGTPGTQLEYKYTLGSWDHVEKGAACEELANRLITIDGGATDEQTVQDTILNWRNVAPCPD